MAADKGYGKLRDSKAFLKLFGIIFVAVGVLLIAVAAALAVYNTSLVDNAEVVEAVISDIVVSAGADGDREYDAFVDYEYNGRNYSMVHLSEYSSRMYEGLEIELYVDKDNPERVHTKTGLYMSPVILLIIGIVFLPIGIVPLVLYSKEKNRRKKLLTDGVRVYGEVQGGEIDRTYTVNGRHPYKLRCVYEDANSGQPVICMSGALWDDPEAYIGMQVLIYVDGSDRSRYYVDLDSIQAH